MVQKIIKGKNIFDEERIYTFNLIDAATGLKVFYEIVPMITELIPQLKIDFDGLNKDVASIGHAETLSSLIKMISFEKTKEWAAIFLKNGTVSDGKTTWSMGEDGLGDYALGDPLEIHTAILYAVRSNYPKYLDPFFSVGETSAISPATPEKANN